QAAYLFSNSTGTDCFANSVVNILLSITPLMEELSTLPPGNQVVDLLVMAAKRKTGDVPRRLRLLFKNFLIDQHDPADFLKEVIKSLDIMRPDGTIIRDDFRINITYQAECVSGCTKEVDASFEKVILSVAQTDKYAYTIGENVRARLVSNFNTNGNDHSPDCVLRKMKTMEVCTSEMPRYFILALQIYNMENFKREFLDTPFRGITENDTVVYGKKYKITGAIQYSSRDEGVTGHCISWRKMPAGWSIASDEAFLAEERQLPNGTVGFRVISFLA
ncbi:hypothetical protein PENTCL1PPCAC_25724, partial [Pristionchus entomophagus]